MNDPKGYETKRRYLKTIRDLKAKNARYKTALEETKYKVEYELLRLQPDDYAKHGYEEIEKIVDEALKPEGSE